MELVNYDDKTKQHTIRMEQQDFLDLLDLVGGVCSTPGLQDFTALDVTEVRANELYNELNKMLKVNLKNRNL